MSDTDTDTDWRAVLPEEMRDLPFIGKANSMEQAIHDIKNAAEYRGNSLRIPSESAGEQDRTEFINRILEKVPSLMLKPNEADEEGYAKALASLGAPAEPKDYTLPEIDNFDWPEDMANNIKAQAQAAGLTKKQFKQWAQSLGTDIRDGSLKMDEQRESNIQALKSDWGDAFEPRRKQLTRWLNDTDAPEAIIEAVSDLNVPHETVKWLHALYDRLNPGEGSQTAEQGNSDSTPVVSPDEARAQIQEILNNPDYFNSNSPLQTRLKKRMLELQRLAMAG